MLTLVIADDLTGAAEIAGVAHRLGCRVRLTTALEQLTPQDEVVVIATDTRSMTCEEALQATQEVIAQIARLGLRPDRLFKKTDSVLRGHVRCELEALQALGYQRALLLPANPSKGRLIRRRIYSIGGEPLTRTLFRHDPEFPATTSDVVRLVGGHAPYITTRTRRKTLAEGVTLGEVGSMEDLRYYVARFDSSEVVLAGSSDLFQCLVEHHGRQPVERPAFAGFGTRRSLIVLGSTARHNLLEEPFFQRNRVAIAPMPDEVFAGGATEGWVREAQRLLTEHDSLLLRIPQQISHDEGRALRLRHQMAETVLALLAEGDFEEVIIEGGATAFTILKGLRWGELTIADEIAPGVVRLHHAQSGTYLTFKPGSYPWGGCFR